jgi:hypothetical protein
MVFPTKGSLKLGGGALDVDRINFTHNATLTVSGSGIVKVTSRSVAKHIKAAHGSHVRIEA